MLSLNNSGNYHLYKYPVDIRKSFDGLGGIVLSEMKGRILSGDVFLFLNKRRNLVKLLQWCGDGFAIYYKRLEKGTFELPKDDSDQKAIRLTAFQLRLILEGIDLNSVKRRPRYAQALQK